MSERFDREATLAIKSALTCARRHGALEVGGEHLLVGLTEVPSRAASTLASVGVDPGRVEDAVTRGDHDARLLAGLGSISLPYSSRPVGGRPLGGGSGAPGSGPT